MIGASSIAGPYRAIAAALLSLVLLLPNAGWLLAFWLGPVECGRTCCRTKKSCCCRKKPAAAQTGPAISARTCPPGCNQAVVGSSLLYAWCSRFFRVLDSTAVVGMLALPPIVWCVAALLAFALLQRPPPSFIPHSH